MSQPPVPASEVMHLGTLNLAPVNQYHRAGEIAALLSARADGTPGFFLLTEIFAEHTLRGALTDEMGQACDLATVPTGSPYGDKLGLMTYYGCEVVGDVMMVPVNGNVKMPYMLRATVTGLGGEVGVVALRGGYFMGKAREADLMGSRERARQIEVGTDILADEAVAIFGGDMNSPARKHGPVLEAAGYRRLTTEAPTWPSRRGLRTTTRDAWLGALPFLIPGTGVSADAIYGMGPITSVASRPVANRLSDHRLVDGYITRARPQLRQVPGTRSL